MAELPEKILRGAFSRDYLGRAGVTGYELRGPLWRSRYHGRHTWALTDANGPLDRMIEAFSVLPRDGALAGWAAAFYHGATDLDGRNWRGDLLPVLFALPAKRRVGEPTSRPFAADDVIVASNRRLVTAPERTCFDLMRRSSLEEAVVAADAMLRAKIVTIEGVATYVENHAGWKGVATARRARELADPNTASGPESRMRVIWIVDAGLPRPLVNAHVRSSAGALIGIADLLDPETGLVGEYDGAQHRELDNHTADNVREEQLEAHNLTVVRATSVDITRQRTSLVRRLQSGHVRARRRNKRLDRWQVTRPD